VPSRLSRRLVVALSGIALAAGLVASSVTSAPTGAQVAQQASSARAVEPDLHAPLRPSVLQQAPIQFRGGPITASTGERVDVRVSDGLPVETSSPEQWAEFLVGMTHGREISDLTTFVVTFDEVQDICGDRTAGCYAANRMVVLGEPALDLTPEEIVRHEYGHHVAYHRDNAPWDAIDWGPKRWASTAGVCVRAARREAFPGDQGSNYVRNPGEAWAETYRLMDERKAGVTTATWPIVSSSFFPTQASLQAAEQDVLQPWSAPTTTVSTRVFRQRTPKVWWIPLSTPLDGDLAINAAVPSSGNHEIALVSANRRTVIRRAQWVGQRVKRLQSTVCGQRSLFVRVTQKGSLGRVRVSVTAP
jgi:hypothetical protein